MPSLKIVKNPTEQLQNLIENVRSLFLAEVALAPELFDKQDVERVLTDNWQVERFLTVKRYNVPEAVKMMISTLKWRNDLGIPVLRDCDFPQEFFRIGSVFGCGTDREGNGMVYTRLRLHRPVKNIERLIKQFLMYNFEKVDRKMSGRGMAVVIDCRGAGLANLDMNMMWFFASILINYCPDGLRYILVYEMPWVLTPARITIRSWLPEHIRNMIKFASKDEINKYIDKENLPLCFGGLCPVNYHTVPKECRTAIEVAIELGIPEKEAQCILKVFEPYLKEAEKETRLLQLHN